MNIDSPTLLIDKKKAQKNINSMAEKARALGLALRPHFKTHQSTEVGHWFRCAGIDKITCSSVEMAAYFAEHGWTDITVAFPLNINLIEAVNRLAERISINVTIDSMEAVEALNTHLRNEVGAFVEIDTGSNRTGVDAGDIAAIEKIVEAIAPPAHCKGLLLHSGATYAARNVEQIAQRFEQDLQYLESLHQHFAGRNQPLLISYGDTPTCKTMEKFEYIDELRPGSFVYHDLMHLQIGCCQEEDIAIALACPVAAIHPERNEVAIHGGVVHFAKDILTLEDGRQIFGQVVALTEDGWSKGIPGCVVDRLSQEHGILSVSDEFLKTVKLGDIVGILPVHSCHTVDAMGIFAELDGTMHRLRPKNCFSGDGAYLFASGVKSYNELT